MKESQRHIHGLKTERERGERGKEGEGESEHHQEIHKRHQLKDGERDPEKLIHSLSDKF